MQTPLKASSQISACSGQRVHRLRTPQSDGHFPPVVTDEQNPIQLQHGTCQRHTLTSQTLHLPLSSMLQIERTSSFWTQYLILISLW